MYVEYLQNRINNDYFSYKKLRVGYKMKELLISQIAPIAATVIVSILVAIIKKIGDAVIELLVTKKKEVELRVISSGHEKELNTAKEVWHIIEEKFRITENAESLLGSKADEFDNLLLSKIPGLTQSDLDYLRQAVAGEVNKYKNTETMQSTEVIDKNTTPEKTTTEDTASDFNTKINNDDLTAVTNVKMDNTDTTTNTNVIANSNDTSASSRVKVDNPDNKQSVGTTVNAISAAVPN